MNVKNWHFDDPTATSVCTPPPLPIKNWIMSFMAPQAYTKDMLSKAFDWLQNQPASVKQVATSPDLLVGLYLKAHRQGIHNIDVDAPVSSKRFIDDLKNLKKDFAQFDDPHFDPMSVANIQAPPPPAPPSAPVDYAPMPPPPEYYAPPAMPQPAPIAPPMPSPMATPMPAPPPIMATPAPTHYAAQPMYAPQRPSQTMMPIDDRSMQTLVELQQRFNLSSTQEALRMLIALGSEQVTKWTSK